MRTANIRAVKLRTLDAVTLAANIAVGADIALGLLIDEAYDAGSASFALLKESEIMYNGTSRFSADRCRPVIGSFGPAIAWNSASGSEPNALLPGKNITVNSNIAFGIAICVAMNSKKELVSFIKGARKESLSNRKSVRAYMLQNRQQEYIHVYLPFESGTWLSA